MAYRWRFLLCCLWLCLVACKTAHASCCELDTELGNENLLLAPKRVLPSDSSFSAITVLWRRSPHLQPCHRRHPISFPACYWLILLSGDVECNPGPVRHPCTECCKSVRSNQQGIYCDWCERWTHAACCSVSSKEYNHLSSQGEDHEWICPTCLRTELPYADNSLDISQASNINLFVLNMSDTSESYLPYINTPTRQYSVISIPKA